jgi:(2R)-3-sulfolactate dehydrogenase (NADP+)
MATVSLDQLERTAQAALIRHGAAPFAGAEMARALCRAQATGDHVGGLAQLPVLCDELDAGRVLGDVTPVVSTLRPAVVHVDAQMGFAPPAFAYGLAPALDAARRHGVATLAVGQVSGGITLGYFTEQIALAGFIAIGATYRPDGSRAAALSVPDGRGGLAMHVDPAIMGQGTAQDNDMGRQLCLMADLLAANTNGELSPPDTPPQARGQYYIIIDPTGTAGFASRLAALSSTEPLPQSLPATQDSLELSDTLWAQVQDLAARALA